MTYLVLFTKGLDSCLTARIIQRWGVATDNKESKNKINLCKKYIILYPL